MYNNTLKCWTFQIKTQTELNIYLMRPILKFLNKNRRIKCPEA